jgi:hypothetical protein
LGTFTNVIEDQGIVEMVFSDEITEEEVLSDREFAAKIVATRGVKKFLVDVSPTTSKPSDKVIYELGVSLSGLDEFIGVRFAIVTSEIDSTDSFLETVAVNRGGIIRVFESRDDALAWLKDS